MAVLPAADITLPRARAGGGVSLSCPALAGEERQALSFSRKARANAEQRTPRKTSLQTRREAERREAHQPEPHQQAMRRAPSLLSSHCGRTEAQDMPWASKNGAGALAFRRPTAASEVF